jgi:hypothetical protein
MNKYALRNCGKKVSEVPRYWLVLYTFVLSYTALVSMAVHQGKLVDYPVRPLPEYFNMSIFFNAVVYPVMSAIYVSLRGRGMRTLGWAIILSLGFTMVVKFLFIPLRLIHYLKWNDFYTFLMGIALLLMVELFLRFYERKAGGLW